MGRIDAHHHFWKFNPIRDAWIDENRSILKRDFLPLDFKSELFNTGQTGSIVVQADPSENENTFLLDFSKEFDFIKGIVGWIDFESENLEKNLDYYSQFPLIRGFRHLLQSENKRDYMLEETFLKGIRLLQKKGYTYDLLILPDQIPYTLKLIQKNPDQLFILDHIGKPEIKNQIMEPWAKGMHDLAQHENVYCKLSGMITEASWTSWESKDIEPFMDRVLEEFGPERILWASDWPVCLLAGTYHNTWDLVQTYIRKLSPTEQNQILGDNAQRFYGL